MLALAPYFSSAFIRVYQWPVSAIPLTHRVQGTDLMPRETSVALAGEFKPRFGISLRRLGRVERGESEIPSIEAAEIVGRNQCYSNWLRPKFADVGGAIEPKIKAVDGRWSSPVRLGLVRRRAGDVARIRDPIRRPRSQRCKRSRVGLAPAGFTHDRLIPYPGHHSIDPPAGQGGGDASWKAGPTHATVLKPPVSPQVRLPHAG